MLSRLSPSSFATLRGGSGAGHVTTAPRAPTGGARTAGGASCTAGTRAAGSTRTRPRAAPDPVPRAAPEPAPRAAPDPAPRAHPSPRLARHPTPRLAHRLRPRPAGRHGRRFPLGGSSGRRRPRRALRDRLRRRPSARRFAHPAHCPRRGTSRSRRRATDLWTFQAPRSTPSDPATGRACGPVSGSCGLMPRRRSYPRRSPTRSRPRDRCPCRVGGGGGGKCRGGGPRPGVRVCGAGWMTATQGECSAATYSPTRSPGQYHRR